VDSGDGASSGGNYSLSGTIGQPDAGTLSGMRVNNSVSGFPLRVLVLLKILNSVSKYSKIVSCKAKHAVAVTTKQASDLSSLVVMANN
jgi:hypothetical protein